MVRVLNQRLEVRGAPQRLRIAPPKGHPARSFRPSRWTSGPSSKATLVNGYLPSHFSREYKRFFGDPPLRDAEHLREEPLTGANV
ncbi:MAG TPA: hypothetical protein VGB77_08080 [Abditibacteriaceae bacterium]